jgi:nicotinate-nucleotide adenylyltransferase
MGTDMFLSFHTWRNPQRITKEAALAVFYRGEKGEVEAINARKAEMDCEVELIENPVIDISSTQLRRLLVFGCADSFLPEGVGDYIRDHGFYGTDENYKNLPADQLEEVVVSLLNPNRVKHVLGCRDTAAKLAKIWGADETDALRAGLLHDITKALDGPLQLTLCAAYDTILDKFGTDHPKTLHALTGSLVAERIFGENDAVISAIRSHTTGKAGMNTLEKIIYVADYMEPNRDFPGVEKLRHLAQTDLDAAMELGLQMTMEHLARQGSTVSPESLEAIQYFREKISLCGS